MPRPLSLGVLVSGRGSNLQALIDAAKEPNFPARIAVVIANVPGAFALERARLAGIPVRTIDHKPYGKDRMAFEAELTRALEEAGVELVCLAGFMRLLTDGFVQHWLDRLINIHPSLLPAFKGIHVHERAIAAGVRFSGCTVHFVRPAMDDGPIIAQAVVPLHPGDSPDALAARVLEQEHRLYPLAVRLIAEGRTDVTVAGTVEVDGAVPAQGALINPVG